MAAPPSFAAVVPDLRSGPARKPELAARRGGAGKRRLPHRWSRGSLPPPGYGVTAAPVPARARRRAGGPGRPPPAPVPLMMDEALDYLEKRQKRDPSFTYEVIVVDDGSKDQTTEVAMKYCKKYGSDKVRVLSLVKNRGKGGAVRMGVLSCRGKKILMADADGATKFADIEKVEEGLKHLQPWPNQMAISCGSRAHLEKDSVAKRSYFRTLLMYGFHFLVWFLCVKKIRDTQCGFKLLTREAALRTFSTLHVERWAFDVELLYIAQHLRIPIAEVAVNWTEIEGSKLVPFWSWLQMGKDLLFIRLRYMTGAWQLETRKCN
uniref:Dolichyl-phosphate beta-glucosyltransferase n=1 Tax=Phasianus colchicus TaxID=9054 RepID=A0A669QSJ0_PHACC